jgi:hypothetical protein
MNLYPTNPHINALLEEVSKEVNTTCKFQIYINVLDAVVAGFPPLDPFLQDGTG